MTDQSLPSNMEMIRPNTWPGLSSLSDDFVLPAYKQRTDYVPRIDPGHIFRPEAIRPIFGHLLSEEPNGLILAGPRGSGKTSDPMQIAARLNRPVFYVNGGDSVYFEDLLGAKDIVDGDTLSMPGPLLQAARIPYALFHADEVDRFKSTVTVQFNQILDGYDVVNTLDNGTRHPLAKGVRLIFTSNTNGSGDMTGDYNTANVMDQSFLDRNLMHLYWYAAPDEEFEILRNALDPAIGDEQIRQSVAFANDVRYLFTNRDNEASDAARNLDVGGSIHTTISSRTLLHFWKTLQMFPRVSNPIDYSLKLVVTNKCTLECAEAIHRLAEAQFAGVQ